MSKSLAKTLRVLPTGVRLKKAIGERIIAVKAEVWSLLVALRPIPKNQRPRQICHDGKYSTALSVYASIKQSTGI